MAHTVLDGVSLGYQLIWSQLRQLRGIQLFVGVDDATALDACHLLGALDDAWSEQAPTLLLSVQSPQLLRDILEHAPCTHLWLEVHERQLRDAAMAARVQQAHQRGLKLIWRSESGARPDAALAPCFLRAMLSLSAQEALAGLRLSLRKQNSSDAAFASPVISPVQAGQIYESLASWVLAEHCLDEQGAWAVAGWPMEDVLHSYRQQRIQPAQRAIVQLIEAIDADDSSEHIEHILSDEPLLAYRFMRFANSAALGLQRDIESLRHGLLVLGLSQIRSWLLAQLPHASSDLNLQPVRSTLVLRARLMAQLLDAGEGEELRREIYLCGLLSQIDLLLGTSLAEALARLPLSERITGAILDHTGPYAPCLDLASAMESPDTQATRVLCEAQQMSSEDANRALLRTLSRLRPYPAKGLLLA